MSRKKNAAPPLLDWQSGHTPAWAAVNAAGVSALTAVVGYVAHAPVYTGAVEGIVGAVASAAVSTAQKKSGGHLVYRCAAWLTGGAWTSWAMHSGPWSSWWPTIALGAGAVLGWGCNAAWKEWDAEGPERRRLAELQARREETAGDWVDRLERVCHLQGASVRGVETWPEDAGYTVEVDLPGGGVTVDEVARYTDALRADLRLPHGCTLEIKRGVTHGSALIAVNTVNMLAAGDIPYPSDDTDPRTINGPLIVGKGRDASPVFGVLRSHCGLVIGQVEGGKTNLLHVINAELSRCPDALIWHIDTTGSGLTLPWLRAWAVDGTAPRPIVDWSASTVDEAIAMLDTAEQIIKQRKRGYQSLMFQTNDDKITVSPELPAIIIIADEVAQLPMRVQTGMDTVLNTGRAVAVRAVNCALRGTRDMVSPSQREMTRWRIGMRVSDASEYQHIFSDYRNVDPQDAQEKGTGFSEWDGERPKAFKAYRIKPHNIAEISVRNAPIRPVLDDMSLRIDNAPIYHDRWARTLPKLIEESLSLAPAARAIVAASPAPTPVQNSESEYGASGVSDGLDMNALFPASLPKDMPTPAPTAAPDPAPQTAPETDQQFTKVLDDAMWDLGNDTQRPASVPPAATLPTLAPVPPQAPADAVTDPAQRRALELLAEARTEGLGATRLEELLRAEGYTTTRQTAQEWLSRWLTRGWLAKLRRDGGRIAYVTEEFAALAPGDRVA
ncbi:hypothetical protein [Streptomyces sp. DW26H14]|uniref:hypothetical protein n=1 Tax=Streptomyces sp. DW26H14 TaxID=3435395 RepID=UPI00403DB59C